MTRSVLTKRHRSLKQNIKCIKRQISGAKQDKQGGTGTKSTKMPRYIKNLKREIDINARYTKNAQRAQIKMNRISKAEDTLGKIVIMINPYWFLVLGNIATLKNN